VAQGQGQAGNQSGPSQSDTTIGSYDGSVFNPSYGTVQPFPSNNNIGDQLQQVVNNIFNPTDRDQRRFKWPDATAMEAGERVSSADPVLNGILQEYQDKYVEGRGVNEARFWDVMNGYSNLAGGLLGSNGLYSNILRNWAGTEGDYVQGQNAAMATRQGAAQGLQNAANDNTELWKQRYTSIMDLYNGLGQQQLGDMNNRYAAQQAKADQQMQSRGLGNTTVKQSVQRGIGAEQEADARRLNEALTMNRIDAAGKLSGDWLTSMERNMGTLTNQANQFADAQTRYAQDLVGVRQAGSGLQQKYGEVYSNMYQNLIGEIKDRTDEYPSLGELGNLMLMAQTEGPVSVIPYDTSKRDRFKASPIVTSGTTPQYNPMPYQAQASGGNAASSYIPYGS